MSYLCNGCGKVFGGLKGFDDHRYGSADARQCKTIDQLVGEGKYRYVKTPTRIGYRWFEGKWVQVMKHVIAIEVMPRA